MYTFFLIVQISILILLIIESYIDIKTLEVPNSVVYISYVIAISYKIVEFIVTKNINNLLQGVYGFALGFGLFYLAAIITKGGIGGGDIKLMGSIGILFGFNYHPEFATGLTSTLFYIADSFVIGAIIALVCFIIKFGIFCYKKIKKIPKGEKKIRYICSECGTENDNQLEVCPECKKENTYIIKKGFTIPFVPAMTIAFALTILGFSLFGWYYNTFIKFVINL